MTTKDLKSVYNDNQPERGDGLFLKTEDGDNIRLRFLGLPAVFDSSYTDPVSKKVTVSTKYSWPVYNFEAEKVQILTKGAAVYKALNTLIQDDDWGDPIKYDIKLSHTGKGTDTKYSLSPSPKSLDLPKDLEELDVVEIAKKSPYNENVHLLGDLFTPADKTEDVVLEDVEEGAIDLSEIPF